MRTIPLGGTLSGHIYRSHSERELAFRLNGLPQRARVNLEGWGDLLVEVPSSSRRVIAGDLPCVDLAKITVEHDGADLFSGMYSGLGCNVVVGQTWQLAYGVHGMVNSIMTFTPIAAAHRLSIIGLR